MRDIYAAPASLRCACCRADVGCGDHEAGCANETIDLELVEVLATSAAVDPFENMQPLGGPRKMPAAGLILEAPGDLMGPGRTFSVGGAR